MPKHPLDRAPLRWGKVASALQGMKTGPLLAWREVAKTCAIFDLTEAVRSRCQGAYFTCPACGAQESLETADLNCSMCAADMGPEPAVFPADPDFVAEESYLHPLPFPQVAFLLENIVCLASDATLEDGKHTIRVLSFVRRGPGELLALGGSRVRLSLLESGEVNGSFETEGLGFSIYSGSWFHAELPNQEACGQVIDVMTSYVDQMVWAFHFLNRPSSFIVESQPRAFKKPKRDAIPRIFQRPSYILIDKESIRKRYHESQPSDRKSPMPHLRRAHYRTLTSACHKEPGKRIWVRATHVKGNEVEWREGDRSYRVI